MTDAEQHARHFRALERMYLRAPINEFYRPGIQVSDGQAIITAEVRRQFFHAADAVHGSVYFKMLDDAAFFAANSLVQDVFVLTSSFTTYLTRPVSEGTLRAVGRVVNHGRRQILAEAVVEDDRGRELGRGSGVFVRSSIELAGISGYAG